MRRVSLFLLFFITAFVAFSQNDFVGSGRAIEFDGIDDYIDLGNIYDDVALPITISAWVYIEYNPNTVQYPIFTSQDNLITYHGFDFVTSSLPHIGFTIGDGMGGNNPAFRRSRAGYYDAVGRWVHLAAVARSGYDIHTYVNGHELSGEYQGSSNNPMKSFSPTEVAKIGYLFSNGFSYWFDGVIDELRIWNRALSETELRQGMCQRLKGNESGLIGYWNFDETSGDALKDLSPNGFHGVLKGNPTRVFSGAPVGDESTFLYTADWSAKTLSSNTVTVSNVSANANGVHIYRVNQIPSQTGGLNVSALQIPYYGVFVADDGGNNSFDLSFTQGSCEYFQREDNSDAHWYPAEGFSDIPGRVEIVSSGVESNETLEVDLGSDVILCNAVSYELQAHQEAADKTFLWNTGATTPSITVSSSGQFSVTVQGGCQVEQDTIEVVFMEAPPDFSLGKDELLCEFELRVLSPGLESDNFTLTWQDGSTAPSFQVNDFGTYILKLENACGSSTDTITFAKKVFTNLETYNFISPNNQDDRNQFFMIDQRLIGADLSVFNRWGKPVFEVSGYQNNWDGDNLPSGVYFYTITDECIEPLKGTLTIMR